MEGKNPVQWAIALSNDGNTAIVVFKGTDNPMDAVVGISAILDYKESLDLEVHSGMWGALHVKKNGVAEQIMAELREVGGGREVVVCGHSLGGGYALLLALEMLQRNMKVSAVISHGGPQVIVPPEPTGASGGGGGAFGLLRGLKRQGGPRSPPFTSPPPPPYTFLFF